jgi:hypothetical protein
MLRLVSLNSAQVTPATDGMISYVVAGVDPGIANWIDTAGLEEGWVLLRWQGVPDGADPARFIRDVRVIDLVAIDRDLDARVPRVDIAARGQQLRDRARQHGLRTHGASWGDA